MTLTDADKQVVLTIEVITSAMGDDAAEFINVMEIVQHIIEKPEDFHGPKALIEAARLAALRTKISMKAQYYKTAKPTGADQTLLFRRRKDVLLSMYNSLEENINTLKLLGRIDAAAAGVIN
jgi:hypothetical protein